MAIDSSRLELRNDPAEIARLSEELERFGELHGFSREQVLKLNLALEEVVTNVISYAYEDDREHTIVVETSFDGQVVTTAVVDEGRPYDPLEAPEPDTMSSLEDRKVGGLGVLLARELMDELAYERKEGKNILEMKKRLTVER